jgi:hypothetical protein
MYRLSWLFTNSLHLQVWTTLSLTLALGQEPLHSIPQFTAAAL